MQRQPAHRDDDGGTHEQLLAAHRPARVGSSGDLGELVLLFLAGRQAGRVGGLRCDWPCACD